MRRQRNRSLVRAFASPSVLDNPSPSIIDNNMKIGDRGSNVASLQRMLHNLSHNIIVDGFFGDETEKIINQFQKDHGLGVTGEVTPALLGAMQEQASEPDVPPKKLTTGSYLKKGNSGAGVLALQEALNVAGANPKVAEDGVFGGATVTALKAFQQIKNLTVDGVAGPATFAALGLKV